MFIPVTYATTTPQKNKEQLDDSSEPQQPQREVFVGSDPSFPASSL